MKRLPLLFFPIVLIAVDVSNAGPPITSLAFSPDLQSVVACSQSGVTVYAWPGLTPIKQIESSSPNLHDLAFSPGGDRLAVAGGTPAEDGTVEIISWPGGKSLKRLTGHFDSVMSVCWLDESTLASAGMDHDVLIWNVNSGEKVQTLKGHSRGVTSVAYIARQGVLVTAGLDQSLRVWNPVSGDLIRSLSIHVKPVSSVRFRPGMTGLPMIASASDDMTVRFWQPTIGRMVRFARLPSQPRDIQWMPDGTQILACCNDGHVYLVDPETVQVRQDLGALDGWAYAIAVHPVDNDILVGGGDGILLRLANPTRGRAAEHTP
ncbi:MAG: WD40 repeat domain-containing protein [Planctomycetales bacterium]|nr:WD40 repeat domain-containing protein [Planctomycetales bacterium]